MIQLYSNSLGKEELNAVKEVFDSKWLGKGPKTEEFINNFSSKVITDNFRNCKCITLKFYNNYMLY